MGHPKIDNDTPFAFEPVFIADEDFRPIVVAVIKATYAFDLDGRVTCAEDQAPVNLGGELWYEAPISSYKFEPEVAFYKPATDVVLLGHAYPPAARVTQVDVGIRVGPVQKLARVFGERHWVWHRDTAQLSRTAPIDRVSLTWENAFGGRDEINSTSEIASVERRNPVGTGFGKPLRKDGERLRLPNIENPNQPISGYGAVVEPWGFGFVSPDWQPRARYAGTYDEQWSAKRQPMLPIDFDRRFFNAAAPGLISKSYLRGDEDVVILNVTSVSRLSFRLPGVPPPACQVIARGHDDASLETKLDTVIVDADALRLTMIWRAYAPLMNGPHDVTAIVVSARGSA